MRKSSAWMCLLSAQWRKFICVQAARGLSEEPFLLYEPHTRVTDHAAMDLDQRALEVELSRGTSEGLASALAIYTDGAFSSSYAELTLSTPLVVDVAKGVTVFGQNDNGNVIRGSMAHDSVAGESVILVQYFVSSNQDIWTECHVGGNPEPMTEGCFQAVGTIEIGDLGSFDYTYDPLQNNYNGRSLQSFSTRAEDFMYKCEKCPYQTYNKFYEYYGIFDYANQWVLSAFNRGGTNFAKGNAQFSAYGDDGTIETIRLATVTMNVWMWVIREMEDAIDDCESNCAFDGCNSDIVNSWDVAVALYTGSTPKSSSKGGYLLYSLAQELCVHFGTCPVDGLSVGTAHVNTETFANFYEGQSNLLTGNCAAAEGNKDRIIQLMVIPLVQGTLRAAYQMDKQNDDREATEAAGATFAASILPLIDSCNGDDANIVYDNMRVGNGGTASFDVVKASLERNYACLGIRCDEVGGLGNPFTSAYLEGAHPCPSADGTAITSKKVFGATVANEIP